MVAGALGHEAKFVLPAAAVPAARALLAGAARPEQPYPSGVVESIYFDSPGFSSWEEKRSSDYLKSKLRLRWYDSGGEVYLERKRRRGSRRSKLRTPTGIDGGLLSRGGLAAARAVDLARCSVDLNDPIAAELEPVLYLSYRRERYVTWDGQRVNLDSEITIHERSRRPGSGGVPFRLGDAVIEVKGPARELPHVLSSLACVGCRRGSFSKYAAGLEAGA